MMKRRNSGSENIGTVRESDGHWKQPKVASAGAPPSGNLADINEQLRTEVEELRRQVLELEESMSLDERSLQGATGLARLADENPDPVLHVSLRGVVRYRNPASFSLCRQRDADRHVRPGSRLRRNPGHRPVRPASGSAHDDEATRRIKENLPRTRIVSLSMRDEPEVREKMQEAGAGSYILKTAAYQELLAAIRGKERGS